MHPDSVKSHKPEASVPPKTVEGTAPGKAIIIGEHAVVYGAQAVAVPITSRNMQVKLTPDPSTHPAHPQMILGGKEVPEHVSRVVDDAFHILNLEPVSVKIEGSSKLPIGAGLGSSATLCVVLLKTLADSFGIKLSSDDLAEKANKLEARFHGKPSGLDTTTVAYGKPIIFRKGEPVRPLKIKQPDHNPSQKWKFMVIDSKVRASTKAMVQQAAPYFQDVKGPRRLWKFDQLSKQAVAGFATGDHAQVTSALRQSHKLLKEVGVVSAELNRIIEISLLCGATAAKVTGAGGGGAVLALLPPENQRSVIKILRQQLAGHPIFSVEL